MDLHDFKNRTLATQGVNWDFVTTSWFHPLGDMVPIQNSTSNKIIVQILFIHDELSDLFWYFKSEFYILKISKKISSLVT